MVVDVEEIMRAAQSCRDRTHIHLDLHRSTFQSKSTIADSLPRVLGFSCFSSYLEQVNGIAMQIAELQDMQLKLLDGLWECCKLLLIFQI